MTDPFKTRDCCPSKSSAGGCETSTISLMDHMPSNEPCCGPDLACASRPDERPGYILWHFVDKFIRTPAGPVPQVQTQLTRRDVRGNLAVRLGINRFEYKVAPGLYCVGTPGAEAPVVVTANYKLTFDAVRRSLHCRDAWILVLETHGINVWCAAGKGTFGTQEIIRRVKATELAQVVNHRRLIVPQLGAVGVAAHLVSKGCGFKVIWGPVRAEDLNEFLAAGNKAGPQMRKVTFTLWERLVLVPVEINNLGRHLLWLTLALFVLSGIGGGIFSITAALERSVMGLAAVAAGILAGAVAAPVLLPWLPGRAFAVKGTVTGAVAGLLVLILFWARAGTLELLALLCFTVALSSFLAMNFTGSTPFTSPTGVEKEMRKAIPVQLLAVGLSAVAWIGAGFAG